VQVQQTLDLALVDPASFEPMLRPLRIAVEPELGAINAASAGCLVDKAFRHQGDFIEKDPCQGDALDEILRSFVLAAEEVEVVRYRSTADNDQVVRPAVLDPVASGSEHELEPEQHVPPEAADRLAAHCQVLAAECGHRPDHE